MQGCTGVTQVTHRGFRWRGEGCMFRGDGRLVRGAGGSGCQTVGGGGGWSLEALGTGQASG